MTTSSVVDRLAQVWSNAHQRARHKGAPFDISLAYVLQLWDTQNGACALSGRRMLLPPPPAGATTALKDSPSLDQIVAGGGYVHGNVQLVTTQCNLAKSTLNMREFVDLCEQIYFHNKCRRAGSNNT